MTKSKKKLVIENTSTSVKVFKALNIAPLRLFPGYNYIDANVDYKLYFKGSPAAQGIAKECLREVDLEAMDAKDKKLAKAAQDKNKDMNKAYKVIKQTKLQLDKQDVTITDQNKVILEQSGQLDEQATMIAELQASVAELLKAKKDAPAETEDTDGAPAEDEVAKETEED